jgi:Tfp pilus assembly protein FimV
MTAITHSAFAPRTTRLRLTTRGRRVLALLAALPAVIAVTFAVVSGGSAIAARDAGAAASFSTVTVTYGDTLWSIAERVAPAEDPRDVIDAFARLNALSGGTLSIGDELAVPVEYAAAP